MQESTPTLHDKSLNNKHIFMIAKNFFKLLVLAVAMCLPALVNAQTDPPTEPVDVPIDGGLSLLLAAGVAYGVKKGYSNHKKKRNADNEKNVVDK